MNKINKLRYALENHKNKTLTTSFVCILCNGSSICAELKSIGFNALNITWDGTPSPPTSTAKILPSLDILLQKSHAIESSSFVCSEPGSLKSECNTFLLLITKKRGRTAQNKDPLRTPDILASPTQT